MKVSTRGDSWKVQRRLRPWRRRLDIDIPDFLDFGGADDIVGVIVLIIAIPFLIIATIALSELFLLLILVPLFVLARMLFRRP